MEERFVIKRKDFKKLERYAENIYNTAVVIDYFCSSQKEYEELYNLSPVVKNLRRDAGTAVAYNDLITQSSIIEQTQLLQSQMTTNHYNLLSKLILSVAS